MPFIKSATNLVPIYFTSVCNRNFLGHLLKLQEFLTYFIAFTKLFLVGVIESTITWLLKLSLEYRYVAHVLGREKAYYKQHMASTHVLYCKRAMILYLNHKLIL